MTGKKAQFAWLTVHLALLPTNEDRAKAVVGHDEAGGNSRNDLSTDELEQRRKKRAQHRAARRKAS